jgi:hypothetical protein
MAKRIALKDSVEVDSVDLSNLARSVRFASEVVAFAWRPDQTAVVGASNPELRGNVQVYSYSPGGTRGDVDTFEVTFNAADEDGLAFFTTAGP